MSSVWWKIKCNNFQVADIYSDLFDYYGGLITIYAKKKKNPQLQQPRIFLAKGLLHIACSYYTGKKKSEKYFNFG